MHVIGTAGHVDHGKSSLVLALTGIDPDRLKEEKTREMTIDLGFAWLMLGDEEVGVIDVPGHRDFIENMLAGIGGIDLALLVIAADEGVMPQTQEHLSILDLLEVKRGVVALTKIDLVHDEEWIDMVSLEIADTLHQTVLAESPILPVSARTGVGLSELKRQLSASLQTVEPRPDIGRPRLSIDRIFTLSGFGTIVTGTLLDGSLRVGDAIEVYPGKLSGRIRGLQTHKIKRDIVHPGSRVAVNLIGIDRQNLFRGQVLTKPGAVRETRLIDIQYRHLSDAGQPLRHNDEVKLFVGSSEVSAHARVIGREEIPPGEQGWLQLAATSPIVAFRGDKIILRRPSPGSTLGGGKILDPNPGRRHRRFRADVLDRFRALAQGSPEELIFQALSRSGPIPLKLLPEKAGLERVVVDHGLEFLAEEGKVRLLGKYAVRALDLEQFRDKLLEVVARHHREFPLRLGMDREAVRSHLKLPGDLYSDIIEIAVSENLIVEHGTLLHLPHYTVQFSGEQEDLIVDLMGDFSRLGVNSPSIKDVKDRIGESVYFALVDSGRLITLNQEIVYSSETYHHLIEQMTAYLTAHGSITVAEVRDFLGTSRKYAIALLEHLDERRITRRVGDTRELFPNPKNA